jgi:hypothetical protein
MSTTELRAVEVGSYVEIGFGYENGAEHFDEYTHCTGWVFEITASGERGVNVKGTNKQVWFTPVRTLRVLG